MTKHLRLGLALAAALAFPARAFAQADVVEYYHLDALGNVMAVSNAAGAEIESHDYLPFGEEWCGSAVCGAVKAGQPKRFTGKERDAETGLDYFGARYYRANVGRFTTIDPVYTWKENLVDPQRWNRYAYVRNNPLKYIDPDGRELKLAVYHGGVSKAVASAAAEGVALRFREAGVLNVSVDLRDETPGTWTTMKFQLLPPSHEQLLEFRPGKAGEPALRANEAGRQIGGQSMVDSGGIARRTRSSADMINGMANVGAHEVGHRALRHSNSNDLMREGGARDPKWLADSSQRFSESQAKALRERFNKAGEVEKK